MIRDDFYCGNREMDSLIFIQSGISALFPFTENLNFELYGFCSKCLYVIRVRRPSW
jgi:hypothetical protein